MSENPKRVVKDLKTNKYEIAQDPTATKRYLEFKEPYGTWKLGEVVGFEKSQTALIDQLLQSNKAKEWPARQPQ